MTRRVLIALLVTGLCGLRGGAQEPPPPDTGPGPDDSVQVILDFDTLPPGPLPDGMEITLPVEPPAAGNLILRLSRGGDPMEINGIGVPGWGAGSLSTFPLDPLAPNGQPLRIDVVQVPPGYGVERIAFQMGDFQPSDIDDLWTSTIAGFGEQIAGTIAITPDLYDPPADPLIPFDSTTVARQRAEGIREFEAAGGSFNFPGSVYYDNFVFSLKPTLDGTQTGAFAAGTDAPESSFGGDPRNDAIATNSGKGGAVVVYAVDADTDALYTIDLATGATTIIGRLGGTDLDRYTTPVGMAIRPGDNTIFVNNNSPEGDDGVCVVDPATGLASAPLPGTAFVDGALACDGAGTLYAAGPSGALVTIDTTTGAYSYVGETVLPRLFGLDWNPADGYLYGVTGLVGDGLSLLKIDPSDGTLAATIAVTGFELGGSAPGTLLFDASGNLHCTVNDFQNNLFEVDPATGVISNVRTADHSPQGMGRTAGVAAPSTLPEPPSVLLLLNGAVFNPPGDVAWVNGKTLTLVVSGSDPNASDAVTLAGTWNGMALMPEDGGGPTLAAQVGSNPAERVFSWTPAGMVGPHNFDFTATSGAEGEDTAHASFTLFFPPEGEDTDGDGLLDDWEENGYDYDPGDGSLIHVDLPGLGADPLVKDVFVVLDYMVGTTTNQNGDPMVFDHRPTDAAIQLVKDAFMPPLGDPRAGRHEDIALHVLVRHKVDGTGMVIPGPDGNPQPRPDFAPQLGMLSGGAYAWTAPPGATIPYFDDLKEMYFPPELRQAMHYGVCAHKIGGTYSGMSRGSPESDFIVSLGDILDARSTDGRPAGSTVVPTEWEQGGTFMHEVGHNLGLLHGGDENVLNKPNYLSVMNLPFQLQGLRYDGEDGFLDYSFAKLSDLPEAALNETTGVTGPAGLDLSLYGTTWFFRPGELPGALVQQWTSAANGPVNWYVDHLANPPGTDGYDAMVAADINRSGTQSTLTGFDDWAHLNFLGGVMGTGAPLPRPLATPVVELTLETAQAQRPAGLAVLYVHRATGQGTLTWKPVGKKKDGITYNVYRSVNGEMFMLLANTANSNYNDKTVTGENHYEYTVTVVNALGLESAGPERVVETPK